MKKKKKKEKKKEMNNNEELEHLIKSFIKCNPIPSNTDPLIIDLYNNMYNKDYVKHFARTNFNNLAQMQEFFYRFVHVSRMKLSANPDIYSYPRIIEMLWDGINGWQW